ncbi:MAG TPA: twin-arginine translocase TatA/TatE family subunit [Deltaproteobacteria bacterium]|nr:twin-arginine translocase TatA/TatE family subunit [Deltaproteobacteria bacterium]
MFGIGGQELFVILIIALLVIGPKNLPEIARTLGKAFGQFQRAADDLKREIDISSSMSSSSDKDKEKPTEKPAEQPPPSEKNT